MRKGIDAADTVARDGYSVYRKGVFALEVWRRSSEWELARSAKA